MKKINKPAKNGGTNNQIRHLMSQRKASSVRNEASCWITGQRGPQIPHYHHTSQAIAKVIGYSLQLMGKLYC